ncbi:MAG: inorganic phosphate transporter, partial [Betaproteobacteria bacterium]|nr:inorganic phosphate transporter [Betaproteobacteria bacterium]
MDIGLLIAVALAFDFMNGFHDGANSISSIVATGVLTPKQAVLFASFFNFAALWVFHLKVAATIGKGTVDPSFVDHYVIFGALCGALALETSSPGSTAYPRHRRMPWSGSGRRHRRQGGRHRAPSSGAVSEDMLFILNSPFVGFMLGGLLMVLVAWLFRHKTPGQVNHWFRYGQLFASGGPTVWPTAATTRRRPSASPG